MIRNNTAILSTALLDAALIEKAGEHGVEIEALPFIDIAHLPAEQLIALIEPYTAKEAVVAFTSQNALAAVVNILGGRQPNWDIYCLEGILEDRVREYFKKGIITSTAMNAAGLADRIIADKTAKKVVFFCGDIRRQELPGKLAAAGIEMEEVITYQTVETQHKVTQAYRGILFFSPSAVNSFFAVNTVAKDTVLFAIGNTTASAITSNVSNTVITGKKQSKEALVEAVIAYYTGTDTKY